jgi:hypothetical protein
MAPTQHYLLSAIQILQGSGQLFISMRQETQLATLAAVIAIRQRSKSCRDNPSQKLLIFLAAPDGAANSRGVLKYFALERQFFRCILF